MRKNKFISSCALAVLLVSWTAFAQAGVIAFDDVTPNISITNEYNALGVTFTGSGNVQAGISNGNPGNWGLDGTNGPYFYGIQAGQLISISFDSTVSILSLDTSRSNGSNVGNTFTLKAYLLGSLVDSETIVQQDINTWTTVAVSGGFDEIQLTSADGARPVYGIDNICWNEDFQSCQTNQNLTPVPTMSVWSMLLLAGLLGLLAFAAIRRTV